MRSRTALFISLGAFGLIAIAFIFFRNLPPRQVAEVVPDGASQAARATSQSTPSSPINDGTLSRPDPAAARIAPVYLPTPGIKDRTQPLMPRLDELKALAESDASVAYDLGEAISQCAGGEVGDQALKSMLGQGVSGRHVADALLDKEEYCYGLSEEDFAYALSALDKAASTGLVEAQLAYVDSAGSILAARPEYRFDDKRIADFKRKSMEYLKSAARNGNHDALARMAQLYEDGGVVGADPVVAARLYREFINRSGSTSASQLRYLELLERRAAEAQRQ